jgi:hypothetical protein
MMKFGFYISFPDIILGDALFPMKSIALLPSIYFKFEVQYHLL